MTWVQNLYFLVGSVLLSSIQLVGEQVINCVCVLHLGSFNACSFFKLNGNLLGTIPVVWDSHSSPYFWYFPSETWSISCVSDEFDA